jgi:hypothetical protein
MFLFGELMQLPLFFNAFQVLSSISLFTLLLLQGQTELIAPTAVLLVAMGFFALAAQLISLATVDLSPGQILVMVAATLAPFWINLDLMVSNLWHSHTELKVHAGALDQAVIYLIVSGLSGFIFFHKWKK